MPKKAKLTDAQKMDVVLRLLRKEEPASVLARRYGISDPTLYRWRDEFLAGGKAALANGGTAQNGSSRRVQELERELAERDQVIGEITIANRILKKLSDGSI